MSTKFAIDRIKLSNFLKLITLKGEIENKDALFNLSEKELSTILVSPDKTLAIRGSLKGQYEEIGDVGITNLPQFIKYIDSMDEACKAEFVKNRLNLSSKSTKVSVVLQNAEYIVNKLDGDKFDKVQKTTKKGISFNLPKETVLDLIRKFEIVPSQDLILSASKGKLSLNTKNMEDTELFADFDVEKVKVPDFEIKVSKYFVTLLNTINNDVTIELATDNPNCVAITTKQEGLEVEYLLVLKVVEETKKSTKKETSEEAVNV